MYDGNGHVAALTDNASTLIGKYEYGIFGQLLSVGNPQLLEHPFQWSTKFSVPYTTLLYYEFKHYNQQIGRWLNCDRLYENSFRINTLESLIARAKLNLSSINPENFITSRTRREKISGNINSALRFTGHHERTIAEIIAHSHRAYTLNGNSILNTGGANLYEYVLNNPIDFIDLLGLQIKETGVEIWSSPFPHTWLRIPEDGFSIGFYPAGSDILWGKGVIESPDEAHLNDPGAGINRKIKLDCKKYDFEKFKKYIKNQANAKPPTYCILIGNCGDWVTDVIISATSYAEKKAEKK